MIQMVQMKAVLRLNNEEAYQEGAEQSSPYARQDLPYEMADLAVRGDRDCKTRYSVRTLTFEGRHFMIRPPAAIAETRKMARPTRSCLKVFVASESGVRD